MNSAYQSAIASAAIFNRSACGKLTITGPDAIAFLHRLCTNDINALTVGQGCEAFICDPRAKVLHQLWIDRTPFGLFVETVPGRGADLYKTLDRFFISEQLELTNVSDETSQFHLCGPMANEKLRERFPDVPDLQPLQHVTIDDVMIRRRDYLGLRGYDLFSKQMPLLALRANESIVEGDADTFETLRIEACQPEYVKDIDESRFVMEVRGAERAVSYAKGCFPGQEPIVMARDRAGFINRAFLSMKAEQIVSPGTKFTRDGQEVGVVTSSCHSPRLNQPIAIGYVKRGHQDVGTKFDAGGIALEISKGISLVLSDSTSRL